MAFMLDTNIVSKLVKQHPAVVARLDLVPPSQVSISVITEAELLAGLARRPGAFKLHRLIHEFLVCVEVLPWERSGASSFPIDQKTTTRLRRYRVAVLIPRGEWG